MKRKNKKVQLTMLSKIIIGVAAVIAAGTITVSAMAACGVFSSKNDSLNTTAPINNSSKDVSSTEHKEPATVNILGVGDNLIHSSLYKQASARSNNGGYDFDYVYKDVEDIIKAADIACVNQEGPIDKTKDPSNYPLFNTPYQNGEKLVKLGFDVVNMANNHCLDKGSSGLVNTIAFWRSQSVVSTGLYLNEAETNDIKTIEKSGIKFAFLGYTEQTNGLKLSADSNAVIGKFDDQLMEKQIKAAKKVADVVVVYAHWGNEYAFKPTDKQQEYANKLVNWGADIIFGQHPHVLQPIEYVQRDDGTKGLVVYSLGNFISGMHEASTVPGGAVNVSVTKDFDTNKTTISAVKFIPLITQYEMGVKNIRIIKWSNYTKELAAAHGTQAFDKAWSYNYAQNVFNTVIGSEFLK